MLQCGRERSGSQRSLRRARSSRTRGSAPRVARRHAVVVEDDAPAYVEPAEGDRPEVDGPDVVVDLLEADGFATEQVGDVDPGAGPSDAAVVETLRTSKWVG